MSEKKLCPFLAGPLNVHCGLPLEEKEYKYAICLEDKCQMWRIPLQQSHAGTLESGPGYCGLAGKP